MGDEYLFTDYPLPDWFSFPIDYLNIVESGFPSIEPWGWLGKYRDRSVYWADTLRQQFPLRLLIPFAKDGGSDDIACFDATKESDEHKVLLIHAFCDPGYELRCEFESFWDWHEYVKQVSQEYVDDE